MSGAPKFDRPGSSGPPIVLHRPPARVHILGGEATGKTTVAREIGAILASPIHNLDAVAWVIEESEFEVLDPFYQPSARVEDRPIDDRRRIVNGIAAGDRWVTEGKYLGWTSELLERADLIVFLDHVPLRTAILRILRRTARSAVRESGRRPRRGPYSRLRSYAIHTGELLVQLHRRIAYEIRPGSSAHPLTGESSRGAIIAALKPYHHKVVRTRQAPDVAQLLEWLSLGYRQT